MQVRFTDERSGLLNPSPTSGWRVLAVDGKQVGIGTLGTLGSIVDYHRRVAAISLSGGDVPLALIAPRGQVRPILPPGESRFPDFSIRDIVLVAGRTIVSSDPDGSLFARVEKRLVPLLEPGRGQAAALTWIYPLAHGSFLAFAADEQPGTVGLYRLDGQHLKRLAEFPTGAVGPLVASDGAVATFLSFPGDGGTNGPLQLVVWRRGTPSSVTGEGDPTPVGAIASFGEMAFANGRIVVSARVTGDGARHALFATAP